MPQVDSTTGIPGADRRPARGSDEDRLRQAPGHGHRPDKVVARLRALPETWATATPEGRAELLHSIYDRIVVRDAEFVGALLTPEANSLGLALALPERVQPAQVWVLARSTVVPPRGFEPLISTLKGWRPGPLDDGGAGRRRV
jgi:hypothetical protein